MKHCWIFASSRHKTRFPAWRPTANWWFERSSVKSCSREQPRDHGVRVPHLAGFELIATPHEHWHLRYQLEESSSVKEVGGKPLRTVYRLTEIRNYTFSPEPKLVAKNPKPTGPVGAYGAFGNNATLKPAPIRNWRHLDGMATLRREDLESGVIQVLHRAIGEKGRNGLIDASVPPDKVAAGAQRDPIDVYSKPSIG